MSFKFVLSSVSKSSLIVVALLLSLSSSCISLAQDGKRPMPVPLPAPVQAPQDFPYPGTISLRVDATDVKRRVFHIHESIPVAGSKALTLLFPEWTPGDHSPNGPLEKMAGLKITDHGHLIRWLRDTISVYAFHVEVPSGATVLELDYEYLGSTGQATGPVLINDNMLDIQWQSAVMYPAGYFSRDLTFSPSVILPTGWKFFSALDRARRTGETVDFGPVSLETLLDSPIMAGKYSKQIVLSNKPVRVNLDVVAENAAGLARIPDAAAQFERLQDETTKFFGGLHYAHYDHMLWLSDNFGPVYYEHHQSGENSRPGTMYQAGTGPLPNLGFIEHGFIHSWNGMYRRPAEMWTPNPNTPERDSLFWIYEGLTEYWSDVLSARAGLSSRDETLNGLASTAAFTSISNGAEWRTLQDVNNSPIFAFRKAVSWPTWQRDMFDAYDQGKLIWLGVDVLLRQQTDGKRSLDDFARLFYGKENGRVETSTYTLRDIVDALNQISPFDWSSYLRERLEENGTEKSLDWIGKAGYKLQFVDKSTPSESAKDFLDLAFSLGMQVGNGGRIVAVHWEGPAYQAGLIIGGTITAVNGVAYDPGLLEQAARKGGTITLTVKRAGTSQDYVISWKGGLRQPVLTRIESAPDVLSQILAQH